MDSQIRTSWDLNAASWTRAVREKLIPSRVKVTDAAVLDATLSFAPTKVLDLGCGEGWLSRELAACGIDVLGVDASDALLDAARASGGGARYARVTYEDAAANPQALGSDYDAVVANFSLLGEHLDGVLRAARVALTDGGRLIVQTLHPSAVPAPNEHGWRTERFSALGGAGSWTPMPWYFRSTSDWLALLRRAGYADPTVSEVRLPDTDAPVALLFVAERG